MDSALARSFTGIHDVIRDEGKLADMNLVKRKNTLKMIKSFIQ